MVLNMDAKQIAEKWARRLKGAGEDIRRGVDLVTDSPGKLASLKKDKWIARMTSKEVQDDWATKVGNVKLDVWQKSMKEIGVPRISAGVDAKQEDYTNFMGQLLPHIKAGMDEVAKMPDITLEDSVARVEKFVRHMAKFKRK